MERSCSVSNMSSTSLVEGRVGGALFSSSWSSSLSSFSPSITSAMISSSLEKEADVTTSHDSKTFECSNSSQKVRILPEKLGEIRKSSSYRGKFIQGTDKFVRPKEMFEFSSIQVIEIFFAWKGLVGSRDQQICST